MLSYFSGIFSYHFWFCSIIISPFNLDHCETDSIWLHHYHFLSLPVYENNDDNTEAEGRRSSAGGSSVTRHRLPHSQLTLLLSSKLLLSSTQANSSYKAHKQTPILNEFVCVLKSTQANSYQTFVC